MANTNHILSYLPVVQDLWKPVEKSVYYVKSYPFSNSCVFVIQGNDIRNLKGTARLTVPRNQSPL